jgi:hypothetical protein
MNRNAGLRHGLFSAPITPGAVPEAGAPLRPGSWSQCTAAKPRRLSMTLRSPRRTFAGMAVSGYGHGNSP